MDAADRVGTRLAGRSRHHGGRLRIKLTDLSVELVLQVDGTLPGVSGKSAGRAWREPVDIATVWAKVDQNTGSELIPGAIAIATGRYTVTIKWRGDVKKEMRFKWASPAGEDRFLYITHVPIGQREETVTLICEEA